jgi:hypothetical protein
MKMLAIRIALVTSVALAPLLATEAAYAQSFNPGSQSYDAVGQSRVRDHNYRSDQRTIDEITNNDWNAGR